MSQLDNDRLLRALLREPVDRTPVWIMRQAGRYLPEYRKVRERAGSFMDLCRNPELACEVTLQPLRRFPLDAAILFSDILTVPDAMGLGLYFETGEGPRFRHPVRDAAAIDSLPEPDVARELAYVTDAVAHIREALAGSVPLIGFSGSPWTLATYMVEGASSRDFRHIKALAYDQPEALERLLGKVARAVTDYLNAQSAAGAQALMIFDTWGGALAHDAYRRFSLAFARQVMEGLVREREGRRVPVVFFTKGGGLWLEAMAESGADALGLDWTMDLGDARARVGDRVALQGNLDPSVLYARPPVIREQVARVLAEYGNGTGHVFNLGHGVHPQIPPEHVLAMVEAVHELSPQRHG
ncbi:uroporphyrinogen decarboxylase [Sediminicurvatus halobius]|uniref:Uroporphyrinogen decarboxylase n=1 Tax=Sediminicurvatus halobius TaxID=2182432 RepID=A0A2U2N704_9GAMM|nr:uroporphyrinogen decarboxylase [Spiribacter halobius]PWG64976.1 uroporphyrinogen decarboxylase [Spiribacter halobius]UEX78323.1 uroporphyrinogen decarboxylase [Spiribacter halobius]